MSYAAYARSATAARTGPQIEADALEASANSMESAAKSGEASACVDAAMRNAQLWGVFLSDLKATPGRLPAPLADNVARLGTWVLANAGAAMCGEAETVAALCSVNRALAAGLRGIQPGGS